MSSLHTTAKDFDQRNTDNKWLLRCIMFSSVLFMISPIAAYKQTNKNIGAIGFGSAIVLSFIQLLAAEKSRMTEKLFETYSQGVLKATAETIATQINVSALTNQIASKESIVNVVESLPEYKQARYIAELQLQGLTTPTTEQLLNYSAPNQDIVTINLPLRSPQPVQTIEDQIDIKWMKTHSFFFGSTAILGEEGSGKTDLLAFLVLNILRIAPDTDLKIYDIHYDPDETRKFPNMSRELEESLFISDPKECYRDMMRVNATLVRRELSKDKKGCPIVRVTDELIGLREYLLPEWKDFINAIMQVKQRGRKYSRKHENGQDLGMRMIVGLHSAKKGETDLPSGFFSGANFLALGESIYDSATMFPSNFDVSALVKDMKSVSAMMIQDGLMDPKDPSKDQARPAVVKLKGCNPEVLIIPKLDLSKYLFTQTAPIEGDVSDSSDNPPQHISGEPITADQHPGNDWLEKISSWILSLESNPTDAQINVAFFQITNKELDSETRMMLRNLIERRFE